MTTVGILGGTGPQGRGLALRLAGAGARVLIGSREPGRAADAATAVRELAPELGDRVAGHGNEAVAGEAEVVIVAVPYEGHLALLTELAELLADTLVIDCVNPLGFDRAGPYPLVVPEGSAAEQAKAALPGSRVAAAFHHLSAPRLLDPGVTALDEDVLVAAEPAAMDEAIELAGLLPGVRPVRSGPLRSARGIEAMTATIIAVNKTYRTRAGLRLTQLLTHGNS